MTQNIIANILKYAVQIINRWLRKEKPNAIVSPEVTMSLGQLLASKSLVLKSSKRLSIGAETPGAPVDLSD